MNNSALPEIQIRPHARATKLKLTVSQSGIRLTVPYGCSKKQANDFIQQNQSWLLQTWQKYQNLKQQQALTQSSQLPEQLNLAYFQQPIKLYYDHHIKLSHFQHEQQILTLNPHHAEQLLTHFIIQQAKLILPYQTRQYAMQKKLNVNKIRIATPKTRWGSCSSQQDIMLHAGLLLMPQIQADYVIWHELAHTKYMNHQAEFWDFLAEIYPASIAVKKESRIFQLPNWWKVK